MDPDVGDVRRYVEETQKSWNQIAGWWDERVGEDANLIVREAVERMLDVRPGDRVLEIACGNGALARRLATLGAEVLATDFSAEFLRIADDRTRERPELADRVEYRLVDATNPTQLRDLGREQRFDKAVCVMGLMDMPTIDPLLAELARLLKPDRSFVFALTHPCFNSGGIRRVIEEEDQDGELVQRYAVQVTRYRHLRPTKSIGIAGQPTPFYSFDRPLTTLFDSFFAAGFVLDGFEEVVAPPSTEPNGRRQFSWSRFEEIPPFLVGRLRNIGATSGAA